MYNYYTRHRVILRLLVFLLIKTDFQLTLFCNLVTRNNRIILKIEISPIHNLIQKCYLNISNWILSCFISWSQLSWIINPILPEFYFSSIFEIWPKICSHRYRLIDAAHIGNFSENPFSFQNWNLSRTFFVEDAIWRQQCYSQITAI